MHEHPVLAIVSAGLALTAAEWLGPRRREVLVRIVVFGTLIVYGVWKIQGPAAFTKL